MSRPAPSRRTFEWAVIVFTGICVILLYGLVLTDHFSRTPFPQRALLPGDDTTSLPYTRGFPRLSAKPITVQYAVPSSRLQQMFDQIGYRLDSVRQHGEVPRLFLINLPEDLRHIQQPRERKRMFIKTTLPLILHANELIVQDRGKIQSLRMKAEEGGELTGIEQDWLAEKAKEYGLSEPDFEKLERRVDIIPPSLALAQSAEESGWGTSRFAHEGNAIFGQRTWRRHDGIIPERRPDDQSFRIRVFDQLIDGVRSYTRNLNGHPAYDAFRRAREMLRLRGDRLSGHDLAASLLQYSERGADYVETIRSIIRVNGLEAFDRARLGDPLTLEAAAPDA